MGKMEFRLDLVQVSHVMFGCINILGIVPDAVALAANPGIPPERRVQTSALKERRLLSRFSIFLVDSGCSAGQVASQLFCSCLLGL